MYSTSLRYEAVEACHALRRRGISPLLGEMQVSNSLSSEGTEYQ